MVVGWRADSASDSRTRIAEELGIGRGTAELSFRPFPKKHRQTRKVDTEKRGLKGRNLLAALSHTHLVLGPPVWPVPYSCFVLARSLALHHNM
jgi:hypothetical protein